MLVMYQSDGEEAGSKKENAEVQATLSDLKESKWLEEPPCMMTLLFL